MKIITALDNQNINEKLQKYEKYEIMAEDILYQEGILELLEQENNIEIILMKENLDGKLVIGDFIDDIRIINEKIRIIVILENENTIEILIQKNIEYLYSKNLTMEKIIRILDNKENNKEKKYYLIKNDIVKGENKKINSNIVEIIKKNFLLIFDYIYKKRKKNNKAQIVSFIGSGGIGKSIFCASMAKLINKKVLIMDLDILNNSMHTLFGTKKRENKDIIIKINNNIDLLSGINFIKNSEMYIQREKIKSMIENLKNNYDYIFIDTSSECFFDYTQAILENSDMSVLLIEGNLLEIKKARNLLNIYLRKWGIEKNKIKIVINKINNYSMCIEIIKELFFECEIIGKISFNLSYNKIINNNMKRILLKPSLIKEYKKIINKI